MSVFRITLLSASLLSLVACASNPNEKKEIDYRAASAQVPTLEVPPDLTAPSVNDRYTIPDGPNGKTTTFSEYANTGGDRPPQAEAVIPQVKNARIERDGSTRWLVVNDSPENAWAALERFWPSTGLPIKTQDRVGGVMETDWVENRANLPNSGLRNVLGKVKILDNLYSSGSRDSYRTRLERGKDGNSVEIYVTHKAMEEVGEGSATRWQNRPGDPDLEAIMLQRLLVFLGGEPEVGKIRSVTSKAPNVAMASSTANTPVINAQNSWHQVGQAIQNAGFVIDKEEQNRGVYHISVKSDSSLVSKLKFWEKSDQSTRYFVKITNVSGRVSINVTNQFGRKDATTDKIYTAISKELSH